MRKKLWWQINTSYLNIGGISSWVYKYLRIVLKMGKQRALASWQRKGVSAQTWVWKNGARTGRKTTKGLNMSVLGRYRQD